MNAALLAGLDAVYASFKGNGIVDIGLQAALDVGVAAADYVQVPQSCLMAVAPIGGDPVGAVRNNEANNRVGKAAPFIIEGETMCCH